MSSVHKSTALPNIKMERPRTTAARSERRGERDERRETRETSETKETSDERE